MAQSLLSDQQVNQLIQRSGLVGDLTAELPSLLNAKCQSAWQNTPSIKTFQANNAQLDALLPISSYIKTNLNQSCRCLSNNPTFQGGLLGSIYIKNKFSDIKRAQQFFTDTLNNSLRGCLWRKQVNDQGQYRNSRQIIKNGLLKQCKRNYARSKLKVLFPKENASIDDVLAMATKAEEKCRCVINNHLISRITNYTRDSLKSALVEPAGSRLQWREQNLLKYLKQSQTKCGIHLNPKST